MIEQLLKRKIPDEYKSLVGPETKHYANIHQWLKREYGKAWHCEIDENHVSTRYEWANISGLYLMDRRDYIQLCKSCHAYFDYTDEAKRKLSIANSKKRPYQYKPVAKCSLDGKILKKYKSVQKAADDFGVDQSTISRHITGITKSRKLGVTWKYL